jgi:hypothetical protein
LLGHYRLGQIGYDGLQERLELLPFGHGLRPVLIVHPDMFREK